MVKTVSQRAVHYSSLRFEWKVGDVWTSSSMESRILDFYGFQWKFRLEKPTYRDSRVRIYVTLMKVNPLRGDGKFRIQSFIEDRHQEARYSSVEYFDTSSESSKPVWETAFSLESERDELTTNGVLTFVFIMTSGEDQPVKIKEEKGVLECVNAEACAERLPSAVIDYRHLLDDGTLADVTLKIGEITIAAHRLILSSHSTFFSSMLRSDMEESRGRIIEISDVDPPVLFHLLQFIYSGELSDLTMETAPKLFVAGVKYGVEALKRQCSAFMKENLTEGNACSILVLADSHRDRDLRECAISFIMDTDLAQNDDVWLAFCDEHQRLAVEVLNRICKAAKRVKQEA